MIEIVLDSITIYNHNFLPEIFSTAVFAVRDAVGFFSAAWFNHWTKVQYQRFSFSAKKFVVVCEPI